MAEKGGILVILDGRAEGHPESPLSDTFATLRPTCRVAVFLRRRSLSLGRVTASLRRRSLPGRRGLPCPEYSSLLRVYTTSSLYLPVHPPWVHHGTPVLPLSWAYCSRVSRCRKETLWAREAPWAWVRWSWTSFLLRVVTVPSEEVTGREGAQRARTGKDWIDRG